MTKKEPVVAFEVFGSSAKRKRIVTTATGRILAIREAIRAAVARLSDENRKMMTTTRVVGTVAKANAEAQRMMTTKRAGVAATKAAVVVTAIESHRRKRDLDVEVRAGDDYKKEMKVVNTGSVARVRVAAVTRKEKKAGVWRRSRSDCQRARLRTAQSQNLMMDTRVDIADVILKNAIEALIATERVPTVKL